METRVVFFLVNPYNKTLSTDRESFLGVVPLFMVGTSLTPVGT